MSRPYLVRSGERNPLYLAHYKSCIKGHRVTTPEPGFYPSFGGALAWLRAHKKEVATAVNLLRMYPETIEDVSLDPVWSYLEPLIEDKVQGVPAPQGGLEGRRRSKSAGDGSFTTSFEADRGPKPNSISRICKLPPLAATRCQPQFNTISCKRPTTPSNTRQDFFHQKDTAQPSSNGHSSANHSEDILAADSSTKRQLFLLWRPQGGKVVHWPPQVGECSKASWYSSTEESDCPFLPEHDIILNKRLSCTSHSVDSMDNWGSVGSLQKSQAMKNAAVNIGSPHVEETSRKRQSTKEISAEHDEVNCAMKGSSQRSVSE